jgi:hypothetical protein
MRLDIAQGVNIGDTVYNCFMEPLVVKDKIGYSLDTYPNYEYIKFVVADNNNKEHNYLYGDVYLQDLEDEDDAEKSWVNWAKDNKEFFNIFDHIEASKEIYKIGYGRGFDYKRQISYEEMMQK